MSTNLANAFHQLLGLHSRMMTIERPGGPGPFNIRVTPSNYSRNLAGPEEVIVEGREFVISKKALEDISFPPLRRGDRLKDPELGSHIVSEVRELLGFGGAIVGYRIRCS